jgi:hypothetical protein
MFIFMDFSKRSTPHPGQQNTNSSKVMNTDKKKHKSKQSTKKEERRDKTTQVNQSSVPPSTLLKPCIYKRR